MFLQQGFSILSLVEILYYFTLRWIIAKPEKVQTLAPVEPHIITSVCHEILNDVDDISDNHVEVNIISNCKQ